MAITRNIIAGWPEQLPNDNLGTSRTHSYTTLNNPTYALPRDVIVTQRMLILSEIVILLTVTRYLTRAASLLTEEGRYTSKWKTQRDVRSLIKQSIWLVNANSFRFLFRLNATKMTEWLLYFTTGTGHTCDVQHWGTILEKNDAIKPNTFIKEWNISPTDTRLQCTLIRDLEISSVVSRQQ